jgi:NAD(P)-dependent dehydrogenase (short-subunit alcohol dehydrogenase family)
MDAGVAIVTGGARNIGRAIALRLAREGFAVVVADIDADRLAAVAAEIEQPGHRCLAIPADITEEAQIASLVEQTLQQFGRIDVLVNNAAIIGPTAPVANIQRIDWEQVLAVNLTGAFLCARAVLPAMQRQHAGRIINISSIAGKIAYALRSPYAVSKWGLIGLTLTLAKEVGPHNIQVNAICPGPVQGERMERVMRQRAAELRQTVEQVEQEYLQSLVLRRMVTEDEVAGLVAYLASPVAAGITGQAIDVTAGYGL